jgi:hypothetical protein
MGPPYKTAGLCPETLRRPDRWAEFIHTCHAAGRDRTYQEGLYEREVLLPQIVSPGIPTISSISGGKHDQRLPLRSPHACTHKCLSILPPCTLTRSQPPATAQEEQALREVDRLMSQASERPAPSSSQPGSRIDVKGFDPDLAAAAAHQALLRQKLQHSIEVMQEGLVERGTEVRGREGKQ